MNLNNNLIKILEKMNYDDEEREIIRKRKIASTCSKSSDVR